MTKPTYAKNPHHTPHTACRKHKKVKVVLINGEEFIDRFLDRNPMFVWFEIKGKIKRSWIKSFILIKGVQI